MNISDIDEKIKAKEMIILYFSNNTCGACEVIRSKVGKILESYPKIKIIDIQGEKEIELAASKNVFSFPLLILYVDGRESLRLGRNIDFIEFEKNLNRYYDMIF